MLRGSVLLSLALAAVMAVTWGWWPVTLSSGSLLAVALAAGAVSLRSSLVRRRRRHELAALAALDPLAFEREAGAWFTRDGWKVEHRGGTGDQGIDLLARHGAETVAVQCKRYRPESSIGSALVREVYGAAVASGATGCALVTTARITAAARAWSDGLAEPRIPLLFIDGPVITALAKGERHIRTAPFRID
jgi:restriction endonuclease Mrr